MSKVAVSLVVLLLVQADSHSLQRAQNAAKSSKQRLSYFSSRVFGGKQPFGVSHVVSSPVSSNHGSYIMQISAGTPAWDVCGLVDTGSDLLWLQCLPCTTCYTEPDPLYDPSKSTSYTKVPCTDTLCKDLGKAGSCSTSYLLATSRTSPLLLGSAGSATLAYTPLLVNNAYPIFDYVNLVGVTVGGQQIAYPPGNSIFGNVQQQNFEIAYDIVNSQVGFAATTC
ncbi:unnamed protein product [Calypogeia fissa]